MTSKNQASLVVLAYIIVMHCILVLIILTRKKHKSLADDDIEISQAQTDVV